MATLLEMATDIVSAHVSNSPMSKEDLLAEIKEVYQVLSAMEKGVVAESEQPVVAEEAVGPVISKRKAFGKDKITCMLCGKEMKTLARHLKTAHDLKPGEYRKQFDIPRTQPLAAKAYSESRRQMAIEKDLGAGLAKARAARGATKKTAAKKPAAKKAAAAPAATEA
ncbi:MAG: Ros/MucR family transcriptional regulator [Trichloromonadaceae bacterium]